MYRRNANGVTELGWVELGPEIAIALFAVFAIYTAALLATTFRRRIPGLGWLSGHALHRDVSVGLTLLALVPASALTLVLASGTTTEREERAAALLHESATAVAGQLDQFFDQHGSGIKSLAASIGRAGRFDADSLTEWLESHHAIYTDYLTMLAADTFGDIVTATAQVHGQPERIAGLTHNVSDRSYFSVPLNTGEVFVSDVFRGRGIGTDPIVAVSAAIETPPGSRWGVVEGSLDLDALASFRATMHALEHGADLVIADSRNLVIYASDPDRYKTLETIPVDLKTELPAAPGVRPAASLSGDGRELIATQTSDLGWRVVTTRPLQPIHDSVIAEFRVIAILMLATLFFAALLSIAIARRVRNPLRALGAAVRSLDLDGSEANIEAPAGAPQEIGVLFSHLATVSDRLHNSYRQLVAASEAGRHYRDQLELTLARREAEVASRTRELERTNAKLRRLSNVDELTGLANRRRFLEGIDRAWRNGVREQTPVSIAIMDIDHFKSYNDTYGHLAGDQCLARIAAAIANKAGRPLDLVARYGGEEFIMILGDTALEGAIDVAERTRRLVEDLAIPHRGSPSDAIVTLSIGVASARPRRGDDYDALMRQADRALYYAKTKGRNRVAWMDDGLLRLDVAQPEFDELLHLHPEPQDAD